MRAPVDVWPEPTGAPAKLLLVRNQYGAVLKPFYARQMDEAIADVTKLLAAVRPHVALTFAEGAAADAEGRSLIYCDADKLNPCWSEDTPYTGKHWGWTPDALGDWSVCKSCRLRAALAAFGVTP